MPALTGSADDGSVKQCALATGYDWTTRDDPLHWVAILEIHIVEIRGERVEPERGVTHVEAGLTAVAVHDLGPDDRRASGLERTVVLRAALQMFRIDQQQLRGSGTGESKAPCSGYRGMLGTAESNCWQVARLVPVRPRSVHCDEMFAKAPLERTSPPSEPKIAESVPGISDDRVTSPDAFHSARSDSADSSCRAESGSWSHPTSCR